MTVAKLKTISKETKNHVNVFRKQNASLNEAVTQFSTMLNILSNGDEANMTQKRGPGRPRKNEVPEVVSAVKRGPGRPRKNEETEVVSEVKRGPGRPRKTEIAPVMSAVKRGPGRPRKNEETEVVSEVRRGPGRPRKTEVAEVVGEVKRGPGRPRKTEVAEVVSEVRRGPGRPRKTEVAEVVSEVRRSPGRPRKTEVAEVVGEVRRGPGRPRKTEVAEVVGEVKRGPGRPPKTAVAVANKVPTTASNKSLAQDMEYEINRIQSNLKKFNKWKKQASNDPERVIWVIENATYKGVIEGFSSSGTSGRYGITTRVYVNPNSSLVPEHLKNHISTASVNRIRYVENEVEGTEYIERQKNKIANELFSEIMPSIIPNHGQEGSVYAFHLDENVRKAFKKLKGIYVNNYASSFEPNLVKA